MFILGVFALALMTAAACSLPGIFMVLRKNSMLVDAITHSIFPGVAIGYLLTRDLQSPLLIVGAACAGLAVVYGTQALARTRMLAGDSSIGLVFPAMFAVGVLITSAGFSGIHFDTHVALVGDLNLAAFSRLEIGRHDLGPSYFYTMLAVFLINLLVTRALYHQLLASTFDEDHARSLGINTAVLSFILMTMVAVTATAAFNAVGAILVIAVMITPAATAKVISKTMRQMFAWTMVFALFGAGAGFWIAYHLDTGASAAMAVVYGVQFFIVLVVDALRTHSRKPQLATEAAQRVA
ncbi:metal ABC transporter permease [Trueperella bialowiezensis]|uniref:Manganese transport system membrane protein mntB n=1 Tax=Trueperella bialowiezensis TaxID=312285 RepID=A0A448PGD5_9ACTO|nr:metal ABC transporter permease [Trueperella bialowiezensis]VEI13980.1 Manganese transport system membrane protein mntB [Trueperella bialowiezensis]